MNVGVRESVALARGTLLTLRGRKVVPEVIVCPPFIALSEVRKIVAHSGVVLGAQNVFWEDHGPFTGETSGRMLTELGVHTVLVGHSERRQHLGETDEMVNKKVIQALGSQLTPVVCVGETKEERRSNKTRECVQKQLLRAFANVHLRGRERIMIAYEPVWAIGTGEIAEIAEVLSMHEFIRSVVSPLFVTTGVSVQILYGGSVDGDHAYPFLREKQVDGVLVGGASIKLTQFKEIIDATCEVLEAQESTV